MFDLVYPLDPAPVVAVKSLPKSAEVLPIVEESGMVVSRTTRKACHNGSHLLHPVVHLHIINRYGCIYLQRRSLQKDICPGYWDTAVGGHVSYGEQLEEALYREAYEELSLSEFNPLLLGTYVFENELERELVAVYATIKAEVPEPKNDEVIEGKFWTIEEIESAIGTDVLTPNFEQEYKRIKNLLLALL